MDIEKLIPNPVLYAAIGINYVMALFGAYVGSTDLIVLSIFSILSCGLALWVRKKQKNDQN